jgi:hypothetical protein
MVARAEPWTQNLQLNRKGRKARKEIPIPKATAGHETWRSPEHFGSAAARVPPTLGGQGPRRL